MDRRKFIKTLGVGTAAVSLPGFGCVSSQNEPAKPNIVLLFADDMGYGDLGSYGHPTIKTPNLDQMAQDGIRLTSFYVAAPSCTPSRAALLTGRYPFRSGLSNVLLPESENGIPQTEVTLAEKLKEQGYNTMAIGKWHLGHAKPEYLPTANGFDNYLGLLYSNDMIPPWVETDKPLELYRDTEPVEHPVDQSTLTKRYTEEALKFIESQKDDPFFLYLPYNMPHLPINTAAEFKGKSMAGLYGDVIEAIDWSVGQILSALDKNGLDENTLVIFTSDNGPWINMPDRMLQAGNERWHVGSAGPLRGAKANTYEGGMRVPAIMRWPGKITPGQTSAEMATAMDLYPTIIKACGGAVPDDRVIDGNDILPMLKGQAPSPTTELYYFRREELEAVRSGKWKLRLSGHLRTDVKPEDLPTPELFDLHVDPFERNNVAERHPDVTEQLREKLHQFRKSM